ncbi:hypothetical protein Hanom_Chr05g00465231 [Helianthus anomalus]
MNNKKMDLIMMKLHTCVRHCGWWSSRWELQVSSLLFLPSIGTPYTKLQS